MMDCAALVAAQEFGFFAKRGLQVTLKKELGCGTIRERLLNGEIQAAHAPASLVYSMRGDFGGASRPCVTAFIFSVDGSAITLAKALKQSGTSDFDALRSTLAKRPFPRKLRFGVVQEISAGTHLLRRWLHSGGIDPDRDVSITAAPGRAIHQLLVDGHLDGYCAPEPWSSMAVATGAGWVAATAAEIETGHPENALILLEKVASSRAEEHVALVAALIDACAFCEKPENLRQLLPILARPAYLDLPLPVLTGTLPSFALLSGDNVNQPDRVKARVVWETFQGLAASPPRGAVRADSMRRAFRQGVYDRAAGCASGLPERASGHAKPALSRLSAGTLKPRRAFRAASFPG